MLTMGKSMLININIFKGYLDYSKINLKYPQSYGTAIFHNKPQCDFFDINFEVEFPNISLRPRF